MDDGRLGFDDFVVARGPALLRFAYLLTHDHALAEDLVQNALLKAHRRWKAVGHADHPHAYVRRAVVHEFVSWRRRRSSGEIPGPIPDAGQPDTADLLAERDLTWRALAELPPRQRAVLALRYYEALPDTEIAAVLGCAEGTVRSLATRAFAALREHPQLAGYAQPAAARPEEA